MITEGSAPVTPQGMPTSPELATPAFPTLSEAMPMGAGSRAYQHR